MRLHRADRLTDFYPTKMRQFGCCRCPPEPTDSLCRQSVSAGNTLRPESSKRNSITFLSIVFCVIMPSGENSLLLKISAFVFQKKGLWRQISASKLRTLSHPRNVCSVMAKTLSVKLLHAVAVFRHKNKKKKQLKLILRLEQLTIQSEVSTR